MVLFGAYDTADRFVDDDRLTGHFPGPGSYTFKSSVEGSPTPRYARSLVEDGVVRPDGSEIVFRERDSWIRGDVGPKGLATLSVGNPFVAPTSYSTESCDRATSKAVPSAIVDTLEDRYLSPSTRCLTPDHERAAKGTQSPGPGTYYPYFEAWDFAPPAKWYDVNKANKSCPTPRSKRFNTKTAWGNATMPRPPYPARAARNPTKEEVEWLSKRRGSVRPSTAPRCMWVNGVSTRGGLQAWGDVASKTGPIHVGRKGDCSSPWDRAPPRRGVDANRRGPVHSRETRATSPGFREVRYLNRELIRQARGTAGDTPGPGQYNIRLPLERGTAFAGPRLATKCSKTVTANAFVASAKVRAANELTSEIENELGAQGVFPSPLPPAARSQRLSAPLLGKESPGPAYSLPSDFDQKLVNKKKFHPPHCRGERAKSPPGREKLRKGGRGVTCDQAEHGHGQGADIAALFQARRKLAESVAKAVGDEALRRPLGVPVNTSLGRGFLLRIRADGMIFVRLPWGILYTTEVLTH
ncbi:unnamed protein product, partial [Hapterophycus canaliculatus]